MARKTIDYEDWLRSRSLVEARAKRILAFFDVDKLKRKPRESAREAWLRMHGQASRFSPAQPPALPLSATLGKGSKLR